MMTHRLTCAFLVLLAGPAGAQTGAFYVPRAGFVYQSSSRTLRPLLGIPGATYMSAPVLSDINAASVAPGGKWAFVTTATRSTFISDLSEAAPVESDSNGIIDAVDRVAWSPDASFALLYSSSSARLQRVRLTGAHVSVDESIDLASLGTLSTIAISPSGRQIAFGIAGAGLYAIDGQQAATLLVSMTSPAAATFSDTGRLYAVDAETRRIVEFGADLSAADFAIADAFDGAQFEPVGLALSAAGRYLMLTDKGTRTVRVYATATRTLADILRLDLEPVCMERLSANATFILNRAHEKDWLLVLDATDQPRVYFVPATEEEAR